MVSHRSDDCTGTWEIRGAAKIDNKTRIVCNLCGVSFAFTKERYSQMMRENLFGYLGTLEADAGRRIIEKEKRK